MDELKKTLMDYVTEHNSKYDTKLIGRAYDLACSAHNGQKRLTGEPYLIHPIEVAKIVVNLGMDSESIAAALLHDAIEDTEITHEQLKKEFGDSVANIVEGVTKLGRVPTETKEQQQAENIRKMLIAMNEDIRVIIIKLADRLHNMRTLDAQPERKQLEKSLETLEIYAPIAHRLGIRTVKEQLEDLALRYLDPVGYAEIEENLEKNKEERKAFVDGIIKKLYDRIGGDFPNINISGRVKSVHGIYRKMFIQQKQFEEIYDIYAVRVIVNTVIDCYNVLGIVHEMFRPIPGRFKDYISTPKANMYQSLHTTVIDREGMPFEVQIRTWDMHYTAELGIAAHWKYKEGVSRSDEKFEERLAWIRQLLDEQKEAEDVEDIVRSIKTDLSSDDVFGVTPKGDIITLPSGSTIIDFAFAIHSAVGCHMVGAKADGRIVPLSHQINTGEVIEIITTSQDKGPSRDWIKMAKTSQAKSKIRTWFKKERKEENIIQGKAEIEKEFARNAIRLSDDEMQEFLLDLAKRQHCSTVEEFYAKIGYGGVTLANLIPRIKELYNRLIQEKHPSEIVAPTVQPVKHTGKNSVIVDGLDDCLVKFSRCCSPLPGDEIIGFITRGHGVSIHKKGCTNVPSSFASEEEKARWIPAHWAEDSNSGSFEATVVISGYDRAGLAAEVSTAVANMHLFISFMGSRSFPNGKFEMTLTLRVENIEHLRLIANKIKEIDGVIAVERRNA